MDGHLRTCTVDGINLGESIFNWNDRLVIFHNKGSDENIVNIHTVISKPYVVRTGGDSLTDEENQSQGEAFEIVSMFLACYHLTNDMNMPKIITGTWSGMDIKSFDSILDIKFTGFISQKKSSFDQIIPVEYTIEALNNTIPLFGKLMKLPEKIRRQISIALIIYQHARASDEIFLQFLGLVTVLEILFTFKEDSLRKRIASRTSALYLNDEAKRIELNGILRTIYKDRSDLVHGNTISLNPESLYHKHYDFLLPVVFQILPMYIDIAYWGGTKKHIISELDKMFFDDSD